MYKRVSPLPYCQIYRSTLYVMLEHAFLNVFRQFFLDISIMRVSGVPHTGTAAVL